MKKEHLIYFPTIKDFINSQKECIFCHYSLSPILTNFLGVHRGLKISDLNSVLTGELFMFKVEIQSSSKKLIEDCSINISTNELISSNIIRASDLRCLGPHVELQCRNKQCKYNYYVSSSILSFKLLEDESKRYVNQIIIDMECFNIPKLWIQNDRISNLTRIFSTKEPDIPPIEIPLILFDEIEKDKLINKIKTVVNFS